MKKLILPLIVLVFSAAAWFARGVWDESFMMEGHVHIINQEDKEMVVTLLFPSGIEINTLMAKGGVDDYLVKNTGEGSIQVKANGKIVSDIGYVTSMNSIMVVTVNESSASFSQIYPGLNPELVTLAPEE